MFSNNLAEIENSKSFLIYIIVLRHILRKFSYGPTVQYSSDFLYLRCNQDLQRKMRSLLVLIHVIYFFYQFSQIGSAS